MIQYGSKAVNCPLEKKKKKGGIIFDGIQRMVKLQLLKLNLDVKIVLILCNNQDN